MKKTKKEILLGVTGSIAAYRAPDIARGLIRAGAGVTVIMTSNACRFITPLTMSVITKRQALTTEWEPEGGGFREDHISLRERADLLLIAPATANIIAKIRAGIADDLLSTTALSMKAPILIAPAMNTVMYENPATRENIAVLRKRGVAFIEPAAGELACGDVGAGRLADAGEIVRAALEILR
jgi:phosphopantothenoylcysteine decarboxylase/phosphopantothenate--cysteine ligase